MSRKIKVSLHARQRALQRYNLETLGNKEDRTKYDCIKKLTCSKTLCRLRSNKAYFILSKTNYRVITFITQEHTDKLLGKSDAEIEQESIAAGITEELTKAFIHED